MIHLHWTVLLLVILAAVYFGRYLGRGEGKQQTQENFSMLRASGARRKDKSLWL